MDEATLERIRKSIAVGSVAQPTPEQSPAASPAPPPQAPPEAPTSADPAASTTMDANGSPTGPTPSGDAPTATLQDAGTVAYDTIVNPVAGAVRDAAQGTLDTLQHMPSPYALLDKVTGATPRGSLDLKLPEVPRAAEDGALGVVSNVTRDIGRFILGFVGGTKILKGFGAVTEGVKGSLAAGAIGDFLVTGKDDGHLADLFDNVPFLQGPILEAIHTNADDSVWMAKLKGAAEGIVMGGAMDGLIRTVRVLKQARVIGSTEGKEAVEKFMETTGGDELQEAIKALDPTQDVPSVPRGAPEVKPEADTEAFPGQPKPTPASDTPPTGPASPVSDQIEMFPEVVRREEALKDIQLQVKGDRWLDPETGKEKILPISNSAREELSRVANDPASPVHLDSLTPGTRDELLRALASDNEAARFFAPKTVRGKPFTLDDTRRGEFEKAVQTSLEVPYATLKAEAPGTAIEDTLSSFLNYRYMDSADSVKLTLDNMAQTMKPLVDAHLGGDVQSFGRVQELADVLGTKPDLLMAALSQQARAAELQPALVVAGKAWLQSLSRDIYQISKAIDAGTATDSAKIELARRQDVLADLVGNLKSVSKSGARTTAAGRIRTSDAFTPEEMKTLLDEIGADSFKYVARKLSLTEGDPKSVIALLEPSFFSKTMGVLNEFWINSLLGRIGTHIVNMTTGAINSALGPMERIVGGAMTGQWKAMKIGMGQYAGMRSSIFDSLEMARRSLVSENAYVDASFQQLDRERLWIKADTFNLDSSSPLGAGIENLGIAIRMPSRFLTAEDEFLKQVTYRGSIVSRAHVEAAERGLSDTKMVPYFVDGQKRMISEVDEYVRDRLNQAFHPRLENGLDQDALRDARRATFTQPLKEATWYGGPTAGEYMQSLAAGVPWIRHTVLPFVRVPTNIFRQMVYESPLAPLRKQFWEDFKAGGERKADAVGRMTVGSVLWTGAAMLASEGKVTGKGPNDPELQKQLRATGWQPYSFVFTGEDGKRTYVAFQRADPFAGIFGLAADVSYVMAHVDERTQDQLAVSMTLTLANNLSARSYLRAVTELSSILSTSSPNAQSNAQRWLQSRAGSYVPGMVAQFNGDDTFRDVRSMLEAVEARIPGISSTLPPRRDNFGAPIQPSIGWPYREVNPFSISTSKDTPARKELAYWANSPVQAQFQMPSPKIDGVIDLHDFKNSKTGQNAYDRWMQIVSEPKFRGKTTEEAVSDFVSDARYKELKGKAVEDPVYRQHPAAEALRDVLSAHYKAAYGMLLAEPGFAPLRSALAAYSADKRIVPAGGREVPNPTLSDLLGKRR